MKATLMSIPLYLALTLGFTATAWSACPELTGTYSCAGESGKSIHVELQKLAPSFYQLEDQLVIQAGKHGVENIRSGEGFKMVITATCNEQSLDVDTEVSDPKEGKFLSFVQRSYIPKPTGDLDVLVTWNDSINFESALIRCQKKLDHAM